MLSAFVCCSSFWTILLSIILKRKLLKRSKVILINKNLKSVLDSLRLFVLRVFVRFFYGIPVLIDLTEKLIRGH